MEKQILEKLLPEGKATVAIGRFLTQSTRAELNKKIAPLHKELPEDIFNIIWEYWKKKRLSVDYGRTPLIPRLVIEKDRVHTLSAKNEQFRLSQAQLRWEYHKVCPLFEFLLLFSFHFLFSLIFEFSNFC